MREHPPELAAVVERQQHIATRAQLLEAGYDDMYLYRQARRGLWQRVLPATYALVTGVLTDEQRRISAALYAGPQAQLTGLAALTWYGFRQIPRLRSADGAALPTPDGYLIDSAVALEVDSQEYHFSPSDWARTLDRHNELSRHGVMVLHVTPAQLRHHPDRIRRTVEDAYESRRGLGATLLVRVDPSDSPPQAPHP